MPYIQLDGQQYALGDGDADVGASPDADIRLLGAGIEAVCVTVSVSGGQVLVQRRAAQPVRVNGVPLGMEPTPLMHGDKVEIAGRELYFGDDRKAGNTQFVPSVHAADAGRNRFATPGRPNGVTGGRLVSLVDGREYPVPIGGLVIGRDPTCDVVVASGDVSRKHAVIAPGVDEYMLTDTSTNGLVLNARPAAGSQPIRRGDVLKVGGEEFRFHADAAPVKGLVLATLEVVNAGITHGALYEITAPLAHVGRGAHNDIVIPDESISDSHAKFQRRDTGWFVVDMGSTNGTYVGGRRIEGEAQLVGAPNVRFGGIKFVFRPAAGDALGGVKGTRAIAAPRLDRRPPTPAQQPVAARVAMPTPVTAAPADDDLFRRSRVPSLVWAAVVALLALFAFLLLMSR